MKPKPGTLLRTKDDKCGNRWPLRMQTQQGPCVIIDIPIGTVAEVVADNHAGEGLFTVWFPEYEGYFCVAMLKDFE